MLIHPEVTPLILLIVAFLYLIGYSMKRKQDGAFSLLINGDSMKRMKQ
tara:strand:+ start:232 stop:375 length:144 start_codon:yes stop_codon:yes gene_type:complete